MVQESPAVIREGDDTKHEDSDRAAKSPRLTPPDQQMMMLRDMTAGVIFCPAGFVS